MSLLEFSPHLPTLQFVPYMVFERGHRGNEQGSYFIGVVPCLPKLRLKKANVGSAGLACSM